METIPPVILRLNIILGVHRGLRQGLVAAEMGMGEGTLSRILNGRQEPSSLALRAIEQWLTENEYKYPVAGKEPV